MNVQALDLALGSGGFDIVHVNLTRGLSGDGATGPRDEAQLHEPPARRQAGRGSSSCACRSSGRWRCSRCTASWPRPPGPSLGRAGEQARVRADRGRALPGGHSRTVRALRERGLLAGHLTAGAAYGARARRSRPRGRCTTGCARSAGSGACADPVPGSSGPARRSGTAACPRSTPRTPRWRSAARRCSSRGCPRAMTGRATAASPTTRSRCSTCCSSRSPWRCPPACARPWAPTCARPRRGLRGRDARPRRLRAGRRAPGAHHPPRLAPRHRRPARLRRQRPAGRDDGPRLDRGPPVLRGRPRRRQRAGRARRAAPERPLAPPRSPRRRREARRVSKAAFALP